jgi:MATE family multidrug resistance protein
MASSWNHQNSGFSPNSEPSVTNDTQNVSALDVNDSSANSPPRTAPEHSLSNYYTRPSYVAGAHPTILPTSDPQNLHLSREEHAGLIRDEITLLRDNHLLSPSAREANLDSSIRFKGSFPDIQKPKSMTDEEEGFTNPSESSPLLGHRGNSGERIISAEEVDQKWEDAVLSGRIQTTWQRETKVLARNAGPLIVTMLLQYSLTVASIFAIGHLGKVQLGAVSLASSKCI